MNDRDTSSFQQVVMDTKREKFRDEVNRLLMDGWTVVPGTFSVATSEVVARPDTPGILVGHGGTSFIPTFFIALQRTERNAASQY